MDLQLNKYHDFLIGDLSYGLVLTRSAKGCKQVLLLSDKDTLSFFVMVIFDTYANYMAYVAWRMYKDPTIFFPQVINSPIFPTVDLAGWTAAEGAGVYLPNIVTERRAAQNAAGISIDICNNDYIYNPVVNASQFVGRYFAGYVNTANTSITESFSVDTTGAINYIFNATDGSNIVQSKY